MTKLLNIDCNVDPERISENISMERISKEELEASSQVDADVVVWNNNLDFNPALVEKMQEVKLFVNWGTDDSNMPDLEIFESNNITAHTTRGYCTKAVIDFTTQKISENKEILKPDDTIGFIGMGRIGYTLAKDLKEKYGLNIAYHTPTPKEGLEYFHYLDLGELQLTSKVVIVVVNHGESLVDMEALSKNPNKPLIINLSKEGAFPVSEVENLINSGVVGGFISDNKTPQERPELESFYTGHIAYKSEEAKEHKHFILQGLINRLRAETHGEDFSIYIARHGQTEWNKQKRLQGRLNSALTKEGREQAKRLANFLKDRNIESIYSSPLGRSVETAQIVSEVLGIGIRLVEKFIEMNFGDLQGKLRSSIECYPDFLERKTLDKLRTPYPGGESYYDIALRVQRDIDKIISVGENTVIVGHESTNRMIRGFVGQYSLEDSAKLKQPNSHLLEYSFSSKKELKHEL